MVEPPAIGDAADYRDLVGQRRVGHHHAHPVVMRAHIERILVRQRDVDRFAGIGPLGEGRDPGLAAAHRAAHGVAVDRGQHRHPVLLLARRPDQRRLAVRIGRIRAERLDRHGRDLFADRGRGVDQRAQILDIALPGERVPYHRHDGDLPERLVRLAAHLAHGLVDGGEQLPDMHDPPRRGCGSDFRRATRPREPRRRSLDTARCAYSG